MERDTFLMMPVANIVKAVMAVLVLATGLFLLCSAQFTFSKAIETSIAQNMTQPCTTIEYYSNTQLNWGQWLIGLAIALETSSAWAKVAQNVIGNASKEEDVENKSQPPPTNISNELGEVVANALVE